MGGAATAAKFVGRPRRTQLPPPCPAAAQVRLRWRVGDEIIEAEVFASAVGELTSRCDGLLPLPPESEDADIDPESVPQASRGRLWHQHRDKVCPVRPPVEVLSCGHELHALLDETPLFEALDQPWSPDGLVVWVSREPERSDWLSSLPGIYAVVSERALRQYWWAAVSAGDVAACVSLIGSAKVQEESVNAEKLDAVDTGATLSHASPLFSWRDSLGRTALVAAIDAGDEVFVHWLAEAAANVNEEHADGSALERCMARVDKRLDSLGQFLCGQHGAMVPEWSTYSPEERCFRAAETHRTWLVRSLFDSWWTPQQIGHCVTATHALDLGARSGRQW